MVEANADGVAVSLPAQRCYINEYTVSATITQKATQATRVASSPKLKSADSGRPAGLQRWPVRGDQPGQPCVT